MVNLNQSEPQEEDKNPATAVFDRERSVILSAIPFKFGSIQRGDCLIEGNPTFTLFSDGSTLWVCDISSGDTGDEWVGFFRILNSGNEKLFDTGRYHFDISDKDVKKRWTDHRGANASYAQHFDQAAGIMFHCSC